MARNNCKKCKQGLPDDCTHDRCDGCRAKRSARRKKIALALGLGIATAVVVAFVATRPAGGGAGDHALDDLDHDEDDEDEDDWDEDDWDEDEDALANMGRAIDMLNGEEPYDADFVEAWL